MSALPLFEGLLMATAFPVILGGFVVFLIVVVIVVVFGFVVVVVT